MEPRRAAGQPSSAASDRHQTAAAAAFPVGKDDLAPGGIDDRAAVRRHPARGSESPRRRRTNRTFFLYSDPRNFRNRRCQIRAPLEFKRNSNISRLTPYSLQA